MSDRVPTLSAASARRVALGAQGFADAAPAGRPDIRHLRRVLRRVGLIQMDSVNVLARAHYLPMYSRLGPYPTALLDRAAQLAPRELFEYWGHEASLVPVDLQPALRWRMAEAERHAWGGMRRLAAERPGFVRWVRDEVAERGPVTAREIQDDAPRATGNWGWNWSDVKTALEWLFWCGEVTAAARLPSFERQYDLTERVLPAHVVQAPTPEPAEAYRRLVRVAAGALGVATESDLRDYFRLPATASRGAVAELVEAGELVPVRVAGWRQPAYLDPAAKRPRSISARALISPFDPLVWERSRAERLFGFTYRIEIYVPAPRRVHGYYVLPFLLDDALVARVDLKADRAAGVLRVPAAWIEPDPRGGPARVAAHLAAELRRLADWLGLAEIATPERGDLAAALTAELSAGAAGTTPSGIVGTSAKGRT
ncbi:MAG TPA: crosslink repair DNA glycosylase YcaQ family protein [Actinocatenispora sp.]